MMNDFEKCNTRTKDLLQLLEYYTKELVKYHAKQEKKMKYLPHTEKSKLLINQLLKKNGVHYNDKIQRGKINNQ